LQEKQGHLEPKRNKVFHHMIYHMSLAGKQGYPKSTKIFIQRSP
jgi:hypothetical protein